MLTLTFIFLVSALLTALVRSYLVQQNVLDVPNWRSSHRVPTPRGGGVSIVVVFLAIVLWFAHTGAISTNLGCALIGGGLMIAAVGFLDDHFGVPARLRLLIHFAAAGWALWQLDGMGPLHLGWIVWNWGWIGQVVALVALVWMINLHNFMDGIDGLAGVEAVSAATFGSVLLASGGLGGLAQTALALTAATAGFLVWNWPPAKVFMGDVGSGFLGLVFGVLALASARQQPWMIWPWVILLSVFVVDATVTLARRWCAGERWYEAHCSHAYQNAARRWASHLKVTLTIAVINAVWLFPLAWAAYAWRSQALLIVVAAWAPLVYAAVRCGTGQATTALTVQKPVAAEDIAKTNHESKPTFLCCDVPGMTGPVPGILSHFAERTQEVVENKQNAILPARIFGRIPMGNPRRTCKNIDSWTVLPQRIAGSLFWRAPDLLGLHIHHSLPPEFAITYLQLTSLPADLSTMTLTRLVTCRSCRESLQEVSTSRPQKDNS